MKKRLFILILLCNAQGPAYTAARRLATTSVKAIIAAGIIGSNSYCTTQSGCMYDHKTKPLIMATCCPRLSDDVSPRNIGWLKTDWSVESSHYNRAFTIKHSCASKEEMYLIEGLLHEVGIKATRNDIWYAMILQSFLLGAETTMAWEIKEKDLGLFKLHFQVST